MASRPVDPPVVIDSEYFTDEVLDKPDISYVGKKKTLVDVITEKLAAQKPEAVNS